MVEDLLAHEFCGRIAVVSSFGAESAVLLHMVSDIDIDTPVLFLDTGRTFPETLEYRDRLVSFLGLRNVLSVHPSDYATQGADPDGTLFRTAPDRCCFVRKVEPLHIALQGFNAWINGRKGGHGGRRANMVPVEQDGRLIKFTPFWNWGMNDVDLYFNVHGLPRHPLYTDGYMSIGCYPCTTRPVDFADPRSGRWPGLTKTECGIHRR